MSLQRYFHYSQVHFAPKNATVECFCLWLTGCPARFGTLVSFWGLENLRIQILYNKISL